MGCDLGSGVSFGIQRVEPRDVEQSTCGTAPHGEGLSSPDCQQS